MRTELKERRFTSEAEEAAWWDANQDALAQEFESAAATGHMARGTSARRIAARIVKNPAPETPDS
jgi:hypothetical protein